MKNTECFVSVSLFTTVGAQRVCACACMRVCARVCQTAGIRVSGEDNPIVPLWVPLPLFLPRPWAQFDTLFEQPFPQFVPPPRSSHLFHALDLKTWYTAANSLAHFSLISMNSYKPFSYIYCKYADMQIILLLLASLCFAVITAFVKCWHTSLHG